MNCSLTRAASMALLAGLFVLPTALSLPHSLARAGRLAAGRGLTRSMEGALPLAFEVNRGQASSQAHFIAHGSGYTLFMTTAGPVFTAQPTGGAALRDAPATAPNGQRTLGLSFTGAHNAHVSGVYRLRGVVNYLIGRDPHHWHTNIPTYARVVYQQIYSAIDLAYYGVHGRLEYDIIVRPGANLSNVALRAQSACRLSLDRSGNLHIAGVGLSIVQDRPVIYQQSGRRRQMIAGRYVLVGPDRLTFHVGAYDHRRSLIIDPVLHVSLGGGSVAEQPSLSWATYVGGHSIDDGLGLAVDASGASYLVGQTGSTDFPVQAASQTRYHGAGDVFVTKLNPNGTGFMYSTYLGGSGYDLGTAIAVDTSGNAYVTGYTLSRDFPLRHPLQRANAGGYDAFVAKLNPTGDALVYSTYLGGSGNDGGFGIAADATGNAYVTGSTRSPDFPTKHAVQMANHVTDGTSNAFVTKLNSSGTALLYSTYLGGSGGSDGNGIAVDSAGNAYVVGDTVRTIGYPLKDALQSTFGGGLNDATVAKFDTTGRLIYSTLLGGRAFDRGQAIAVDSTGNAYIVLDTSSPNLLVTDTVQPHFAGGRDDAYAAKLSADGRTLVYGTYLGGAGSDTPYGIAVDTVGNAYLTGITRSKDFPTIQPLVGQGHLQGNADAFVSILNPIGTALAFSTYLGGGKNDFGTGIGLDQRGNIFVSGQTNSSNLARQGAVQEAPGGSYDAFVVKIGRVMSGKE